MPRVVVKAFFSSNPGHLAGSILSNCDEPIYTASCDLSPAPLHFVEGNLVLTPLHNAMYLALVPSHFAGVTVVTFIFPPEVSQGYTLHPTPCPAEACMNVLHLYCIAKEVHCSDEILQATLSEPVSNSPSMMMRHPSDCRQHG